jgi:glutathione peroxidase
MAHNPQTAAHATDAPLLEGTLPRLDGTPQDLAAYRGTVALVVNTASECGLTPQYAALQELYERRRGEGLVVLGFPSADFGGQELDDDSEIAAFCEVNYGVTFPLFARSHVSGDEANVLFQRLNAATAEPDWNFAKYLLDRDGRVVQRFDAQVTPDDPAVTAALDRLLAP